MRTTQQTTLLGLDRAGTADFLEAYPDPVLIVDDDGRIVYVNTRFEALVGFAPSELLGQHIEVLVPERIRRRHLLDRQRYQKSPSVRGMGTTALATVVRKDGTELPVDVGLAPLSLGGDRLTLAAVRDGTCRKTAEDALRNEIAAESTLTDIAVELLAASDLDGFLASCAQLIGSHLGADVTAIVEVGPEQQVWLRAQETTDPRLRIAAQRLSELPQTQYTLLSRHSVLAVEYATERRFRVPSWVELHGLRSGATALVPGGRSPFGVIYVASRRRAGFSKRDTKFLDAAGLIIGASFERWGAVNQAESEQRRFRQVADLADDLVFRMQLSPAKRCLYVNRALETQLGFTPDAWYADPHLLDRGVEAAGGDPSDLWDVTDVRRPIRIQRRDGQPRWLELQLSAVDPGPGRSAVVDGVARDVTERRQAEASLATALERERLAVEDLRRVGRMKDSFLEAISHELRTPLTVIQGISETLAREDNEPEADVRRLLLERLAVSAVRLRALMGDLFDLNQLTAGMTEPVRVQTDLRALVADVVASLASDERPIGAELTACHASVDSGMIRRAVRHIIENAIKHTPPGSPIDVQLHVAGPVLHLDIMDRGPGVPAALAATVFEPLERGPTAPKHAPGIGIGLALARGLVELHGGSLRVSERSGGGAVFHLELPRGTA